jgi:phosphoglycolate phosphatase
VLHREPSFDELARLYAKYLWHLSEDIWTSRAYRVLDGAEDLLARLTAAGVILGVISGAMEGAARTKLEPAKLNRYFVFGSYGSDSPDRTEVTRLGIAKAARLHGRDLSPDEVYVVGDTPRDIAAGRAAAATTIGVASGHYHADELRAAQADHVLRSLTEPFPGL